MKPSKKILARLAVSVLGATTMVCSVTAPSLASHKEKHDQHSTEADVSLVTSYLWEAPYELTGTFSARVLIDLLGPNDCSLKTRIAFGGDPEGQEQTPTHWLEWNTADSTEWHGMIWKSGPFADAHYQDSGLSEAWIKSQGVSWAVNYTSEGPFVDFVEITLTGTDIRMDPRFVSSFGWSSPYMLHFTCTEPFQVSSQEAGREGDFRTSQSARGGLGATADSVEMNLDDSFADTFYSPNVLFRAIDLSTPGTTEGTVNLAYPGGNETWSSAQLHDPKGVEGGSGEYEVEFSRLGTGALILGLFGLGPVNSLNDAL